MEQLRFVPGNKETAGGSVGILSPTGKQIGRLTWKSRSPGDVVRDKFGYVVSMIIADVPVHDLSPALHELERLQGSP